MAGQDLAFRGYNESLESYNRGNYKELVSLFEKYDDNFNKFINNNVFSGTSKTIQNDLIDSVSYILKEHIESEIGSTSVFFWQIDETTDICRQMQQLVGISLLVPGLETEEPTQKKRKITLGAAVDIEQSYRVIFNEILDTVTMQINVRKTTVLDLLNIANFSVYAKDFPTDLFTSLTKQYPIFDEIQLKNELLVIYNDL
nr:unnamed protein product [Callosobruchus analis]